MGHKKHPLDVFRSSDRGFDKATRRRRILAGKVIASSVKRRETPLGRVQQPARPKAAAGLLERLKGARAYLYYGAAGAVALLALTILLVQLFSGTGDDLPVLKAQDALERPGAAAPAPAGAPAAGELFCIRACHYNGSPNGLKLARAAQAELASRGFPDVLVLGWPVPGGDGTRFESFELLVGRAADPQALEGTLARLQGIDDWSGGDPAPFTSALIAAHPKPDLVGG